MDLFSGAFDERKFMPQTRKTPSETLPQIDVKPLDIVEPQILGKSSVLGKTSTSAQKEIGNNDFQPNTMTKNHSEKALVENKKPQIEAQRISEGTGKQDRKPPIAETNLEIKYKTIFRSKKIPIHMFFEQPRQLKMPSLNPLNQSFDHNNQSSKDNLEKSPAEKKPKPTSNEKIPANQNPKIPSEPAMQPTQQSQPSKKQTSVSTKSQNSSDTINSNQDPNPKIVPKQPNAGFQSSAGKPPVTPPPKNEIAPPKPTVPSKPKKPVTTIQSIFQKYRKLNKTVTKIVHKKEKGKTQKWVYFADGSSVLEADEEHPPPPPKEVKLVAPDPVTSNQYPNYNDYNLNGAGAGAGEIKQSIKPSNVYFYDHANLVAEFDPSNPNNIALTVYEIETLQQKHKFCKYFDPTPSEKFKELAAVIDYSSKCFSSVYHNIEQLDDEALLRPIQKEEKVQNKFWKKTLRKSNKRMISKKNSKVISKNKNT